MDMHASHFSLDHRVTLLFRPVQINSLSGIILTSVVVACLTILFEGLRCLRVNIQQNVVETNRKVSMLSRVHTVQTILHMTEFCLAYIIMLCVMTFNVYLFLGVIVGALFGFQLCTFFSRPHIIRKVIGRKGFGIEESEKCIKAPAHGKPGNGDGHVDDAEDSEMITHLERVSTI